jgi:hypothetical protein
MQIKSKIDQRSKSKFKNVKSALCAVKSHALDHTSNMRLREMLKDQRGSKPQL